MLWYPLILLLAMPYVSIFSYMKEISVRLKHRSSQRVFSTSFIDINLGQSFDYKKFLDIYRVDDSAGVKLSGVYAIEEKNNGVLFVDCSQDVYSDLSNIFQSLQSKENVYFVRIQTFKNPMDEFILKYKDELVAQTSPKYSDVPLLIKAGGEAIISPFALSQSISIEEYSDELNLEMELTIENVEKVLDEVRPFLIADGGNISIESIDSKTRDIALMLQGACGSCPSSTVSNIHCYFPNID